MSMLRPSVHNTEPVAIDPGYFKQTKKQDVVDGVIVTSTVYEKSSVGSQFDGIAASDFSIGNYIAMDIVDKLKPTVFSNQDIDGVTSVVEGLMTQTPEQ